MLAIIPARGGSKGLPRKNILPMAGRPLIAWTIAAALGAKSVRRVIVSTDCPEIAEAAQAAGADVPFLRPEALATDTATSADVVRHALEACPGHDRFALLQPTSPLRTAEDIDAASQLMTDQGATSCVSVCLAEQSPFLMYFHDSDSGLRRVIADPAYQGLRRQDLPDVVRLNGALYLCAVDHFLTHDRFVDDQTLGFVMPPSRSVDIDTLDDFKAAEALLAG